MLKSLVPFLFLTAFSAQAQEKFSYPDNLRFSTEADVGYYPCWDTMKVYMFKNVIDIRLMLPAWRPIVSHDSVSVLEGRIMPIPGHEGYKYGVPHVSFEDLPLYHYTHDLSFNVFPDKGYRNLLSRYINIEKDSLGNEIRDTVVRDWVHCEWESGLAAGNRRNKYAKVCRAGGTAGFASAGHERYDVIWNWPTAGDWVHVEGLWIWDRGHPPARSEMHPMRFMATRRNLPDKIRSERGDSVFATRIDLYANGDGSAFYNNQDTTSWVHPVKMSSKDYRFKVKHTLPRPSATAVLKYAIIFQKRNTYDGGTVIFPLSDSSVAEISIPWKTDQVADTAVLAKTLFLYWDEGNGVAADYAIHSYTVDLSSFKVRRLSETLLGRAELRVFMDVGGQYIFFNEFATRKKDVLRKGLGKTYRRKWKLNNSFTVHVPEDREFRIYVGGWEADGVDKVMGRIVDQNADCTPELKARINTLMLDPTPVGYGGCEDDNFGEAIMFHSADTLKEKNTFLIKGDGSPYEENCPFGKRTPIDFHRLEYSITVK
ncbi:MAG: hypothetical protein JKX84_11070 [Flavobacteriales bacterium]|nr:hypothetical protein [Flavobacteriales bacterium]